MLIPKVYPALSDSITQGVEIGLDFAFREDSTPSRESIANAIQDSIMYEIMERFEINETDQVH